MGIQARHVALVLSLNKRFDRKVIEGVTRFVKESGSWSVFLEDDPSAKIPDFVRGHFDGVIADLDDPRIPQKVTGLQIPVVGIGNIDPRNPLSGTIATVGTHNRKIALLAADYLISLGLRSFGYCGVTTRTIDTWNRERKETFSTYLREKGHMCSVYTGRYRPSHSWEQLQKSLFAWLQTLPKPAGILAANDMRARHLLEACRRFRLRVPDDIAVMGVDNDKLICELATPPLTSIIQGTEETGYRAASLLDCLMKGQSLEITNIQIDPVAVVERTSTDLVATSDCIVARALTFIRKNACTGIGVPQIAQAINISRSSLDTHFKNLIGRSVHDEIIRVQINEVRSLLVTTDLALDKIAKRTGFCHAQYLTTVFRRQCNQTPGEYRRRAQ
ncbi:MAG: DNA-binding transcriptional regulator [Kiritimatiellia bacterium]